MEKVPETSSSKKRLDHPDNSSDTKESAHPIAKRQKTLSPFDIRSINKRLAKIPYDNGTFQLKIYRTGQESHVTQKMVALYHFSPTGRSTDGCILYEVFTKIMKIKQVCDMEAEIQDTVFECLLKLVALYDGYQTSNQQSTWNKQEADALENLEAVFQLLEQD